MTETAGAFALEHNEHSGLIPYAKNNVMIIDLDTGNELQYNEEGEICVSSPTMMTGYYNFDSVNNVLEISKKYDVVGTLSANYFRGKNLQIDALGFEDPERQLIKDKGLEEKTPIEK
jgi:acyl-CoA synthetase (AMP-forming)/AMP-acid ligase II